MTQYAGNFLNGLVPARRAEYRRLIKARRAYLERAPDNSQYLIVIDPAQLDEAIFARLLESTQATCIGNRVR